MRTALEIVCGAGTHTEVNKHGRNVKETGDWKNKAQPLFFQVKEMVKKSSALKCWIPAEHKQSSIYVRLASASAADLLKEELAKLTMQEQGKKNSVWTYSEAHPLSPGVFLFVSSELQSWVWAETPFSLSTQLVSSAWHGMEPSESYHGSTVGR